MVISANRCFAAAGVSWKFSESMWQSEHARPLLPSPARVLSWKFALPRQNGVSTGVPACPCVQALASAAGSVPLPPPPHAAIMRAREQDEHCKQWAFAIVLFHGASW